MPCFGARCPGNLKGGTATESRLGDRGFKGVDWTQTVFHGKRGANGQSSCSLLGAGCAIFEEYIGRLRIPAACVVVNTIPFIEAV